MINLHIKDTDNIGDKVCAPGLYYDIPTQDIDSISNCDLKQPIIYGGGAIANRAIRHARLQSESTFFWGGGHTIRHATHHKSIPDYSVFTLAGVRDYKTHPVWVPCASCKSELFDREYEVSHKTVYYGHKQLLPLDGVPYLDNEHFSFEEVIAFLASGEQVITSSYHGVYWASLLGKSVERRSFGSKFHYFKYDPIYPNPDFLEECRAENDAFYESVLRIL